MAAEGHKCLFNVELVGKTVIRIDKDGRGGASMGPGLDGAGVGKALEHLDRATELSPNDLSGHQARLHVLINSGRADEAPAALEKTLAVYHGPDALEAWLNYAPLLYEIGALEPELAFLRLLQKRYPNDHRIIANIGASLVQLGRVDEGLPMLRRAVELEPDDSINNFDLARALEKMKDLDGAEKHYRKAVRVEKDAGRKREMRCDLGLFLHERGKRQEACAIQRESCDEDRRPSCGPAKR